MCNSFRMFLLFSYSPTQLNLIFIDYVADLRAEIVKWWEGILKIRSQEEAIDGHPTSHTTKKPDTWIRIITQGRYYIYTGIFTYYTLIRPRTVN